MFDRLMEFVNSFGRETPAVEVDETAVAVIALALHVVNADGVVEAQERAILEQQVREHYGLSKGEFDDMMVIAAQQEESAVDLFRFTSRINRAFDERQKIEFIGMLWHIVHADKVRNELEDHLVWRIAELIGVSGRDRINKRQDAERHQKDET